MGEAVQSAGAPVCGAPEAGGRLRELCSCSCYIASGGGIGAVVFHTHSASADAPLKFRVPSQEEAEAWVWALYQCAHGAAAKPVAIM